MAGVYRLDFFMSNKIHGIILLGLIDRLDLKTLVTGRDDSKAVMGS